FLIAFVDATETQSASGPGNRSVYISLGAANYDRWVVAEPQRIVIQVDTERFPSHRVSYETSVPQNTTEILLRLTGEHITMTGDQQFTFSLTGPSQRTIETYGNSPGEGTISVEVFADGEQRDSLLILQVPIIVNADIDSAVSRPTLPNPGQMADDTGVQ